jgi:hypothetical protein
MKKKNIISGLEDPFQGSVDVNRIPLDSRACQAATAALVEANVAHSGGADFTAHYSEYVRSNREVRTRPPHGEGKASYQFAVSRKRPTQETRTASDHEARPLYTVSRRYV